LQEALGLAGVKFLNTVMTENIVTVLSFEHRKTAETLVQTALFFNLSIPFLSNFVSIFSVTTVYGFQNDRIMCGTRRFGLAWSP
jgi:hypothetical protein